MGIKHSLVRESCNISPDPGSCPEEKKGEEKEEQGKGEERRGRRRAGERRGEGGGEKGRKRKGRKRRTTTTPGEHRNIMGEEKDPRPTTS